MPVNTELIRRTTVSTAETKTFNKTIMTPITFSSPPSIQKDLDKLIEQSFQPGSVILEILESSQKLLDGENAHEGKFRNKPNFGTIFNL